MERGPREQRTATVFGQLTCCGPREVPVADSRSGVGVMQRTRHSSVASSESLQMRARSTNGAERRSRYREAEMTAVEGLPMTQPPHARLSTGWLPCVSCVSCRRPWGIVAERLHAIACRALGSATCAPRAALRPTARASASSARCSQDGPIVRSTATATSAPPPLTAGSGTTTVSADDHPRPQALDRSS